MSISGSLGDIAIVDLLQFIHMSQRSGTLFLESSGHKAHISFHRGRIASAWCPSSASVVQHLMLTRGITPEQVEQAERLRRGPNPALSLGRALLDAGVVTWAELRGAVAWKIEQTIFELVRWTHGRFHVVADEVRVDDEMTFAPGDVIPELDLDTQAILIEALRLFDERGKSSAEDAVQRQAGDGASGADAALSVRGSRVAQPPQARIQVVTDDWELAKALGLGLTGLALVSEVELRDAGIPAPGEGSPIVVVDRRGERPASGVLRRIRELHPRSPVVALVGNPDEMTAAFEEGAVAVAQQPALASCCSNLVRSRYQVMDATDGNLRSGLARLRRVLGDLRSGLLSATVSLNLMTIVADSVERAVLFVQQRDALVALGAFGTTHDGRALADITRSLTLSLPNDSDITRCIVEGRALSLDYESDEIPRELRKIVDCPRSGQAVFFPVIGARRSIGLIYADNGRRSGGIQDVEIVELATAQVGLAFENELLRRQVDRGVRSTNVDEMKGA